MPERRSLQASDLYSLRLLSDAQISPDGSRVAFVCKQMDEKRDDYVSNVYVVDRHGAVSQFTSGEKDWGPRWSPDGKYLAFVSGRKERAQIHLLSTSGGESTALTDLPLGAGLPIWSPDSRAFVFVAQVSTSPDDDENGDEKTDDKKKAPTKIIERSSYKLDGAGYIGNRRRHIFLIDIASRSVEQISDGDYHDDDPAWSPDGREIAFSSGRTERWDVSAQSDIYVMPRAGGEQRKAVSGGAYGRPAFSPDGRRIAFAGWQDLDDIFAPARIYSAALDGSDQRDELGAWDCSPANDVVSDVVLSAQEHAVVLRWEPDGLYFLGTERGESHVCRANGSVERVAGGSRTITDFSTASDGTIAYIAADSTHLGEVYICQTDVEVRLTHENDKFLSEIEVRRPERLCYTGADGKQSEGWLLAPSDETEELYPLIVYIHGGPMLTHGEAFHFEYQLLAGAGFGVFYPNIHGSSSYGRDYQTSIRNDWGNLDYQDVLGGLKEVLSRPWVDIQRVGIAGGSYGGYMTNWAVGHGNQFRAALTDRCLSNMISFVGTSDIGWMWDRQFGAFPEDDVQHLWDMSPLKYVKRVQTPLLVMHSEGDDRTPLEQGEQMFNALRRLGRETKLIVFPQESHGLSRIGKPSRRVERLTYVLDWFRTHL